MIFKRDDASRKDMTLDATTVAEVEKAAISTAPPLRIFSLKQMTTAAFFGGFLAGFWLMRKNFLSLDQAGNARLALLWGIAAALLTGIIAPYLPEKLPNGVLPALCCGIVSAAASYWQGALIDGAMKQGALRASNWKVAGVSLACIVILVVTIIGGSYAKKFWDEPGLYEAVMGDAYTNGYLGLEKNPAKATAWYQASADKGHEHGLLKLALAYTEARGVQKNLPRAFKLLKQSAEKGNLVAQSQLVICYVEGRGTIRNDTEARKWALKAAEARFAPALFMMGSMHAGGIAGFPKSDKEAYFWFDLAANEDPQFIGARDDMAAKLSPRDKSDALKRSVEWLAAHPKKEED